MEPMSNGDPTTDPIPLSAAPVPPTPAPPPAPGAVPSGSPQHWNAQFGGYPAGPPAAATPAPPTLPSFPPVTAPSVPPGYPFTPPVHTGQIPGQPAGPAGPGAPGGWVPPGASPAQRPSGSGRGRGVAIALLLVFALLAGLAGGFGLAEMGHQGADRVASQADPSVLPQPSGGSSNGSSDPTSPVDPGTLGGTGDQSRSGQGSQGVTPGATADVDKVTAAVAPGVVNINVLTAQGQGAGTGMILTSDGLVLTNNHVVRGATRLVVIDADTGDRYDAKVLGTAPTRDVALIQLVGAKGLDTVRTGNSDTVKVGDPVVALGNAGGHGGTPTVVPGTVVALGRSITASDQSGQEAQRLNNLIQTDANIVPGDSGGPLANAKGEVIAVNSAASVTNQTSATGEGYAIPINDAMRIVEQIRKGQSSDVVHIGTRGVLGVQVTSVAANDPFGQSGSDQAVAGATVAGVADGSGAQKAGVTAGSTITGVDGRKVTSAEALTTALANAKPGDKVTLTWVDPNGQSRSGSVTLTEGPPD